MPMLLPPSQYDHPPQIPVIEKVLPWNELQRLCRASERPIYNGTARTVRQASGSMTQRTKHITCSIPSRRLARSTDASARLGA